MPVKMSNWPNMSNDRTNIHHLDLTNRSTSTDKAYLIEKHTIWGLPASLLTMLECSNSSSSSSGMPYSLVELKSPSLSSCTCSFVLDNWCVAYCWHISEWKETSAHNWAYMSMGLIRACVNFALTIECIRKFVHTTFAPRNIPMNIDHK
jgi:hypothetical protein